jgi:hypothetical protein
MLAIYFMYYNFGRVHQTIRVMAARDGSWRVGSYFGQVKKFAIWIQNDPLPGHRYPIYDNRRQAVDKFSS